VSSARGNGSLAAEAGSSARAASRHGTKSKSGTLRFGKKIESHAESVAAAAMSIAECRDLNLRQSSHSMNFEEFSAVRRRQRGKTSDKEEEAPVPAPVPAEGGSDESPSPTLSGFLGSRGFHLAIIVLVFVECATMPLSLARLESWMRAAAEGAVYVCAGLSLVELLLSVVAVDRLRLTVILDTTLQVCIGMVLFLQYGREYPGLAWLPFLRMLRVFDAVWGVEQGWRVVLEASEAELAASRKLVASLQSQLDEAAAGVNREVSSNARLLEALDAREEEVDMLRAALEIAAAQQQEWEDRFGVSIADEFAARVEEGGASMPPAATAGGGKPSKRMVVSADLRTTTVSQSGKE
jgi:hypothetical protein